MSYAPRPTNLYPSSSNTSHSASSNMNSTASLRQPSQSQSQAILQARIASKRAELENLRQLRDLSANLAAQLAALEAKLGTLRDGAQSVALVLANWENVLRAIGMAAMKVPRPTETSASAEGDAGADDTESKTKKEVAQELPVPLVRIPVQPKTEDGG